MFVYRNYLVCFFKEDIQCYIDVQLQLEILKVRRLGRVVGLFICNYFGSLYQYLCFKFIVYLGKFLVDIEIEGIYVFVSELESIVLKDILMFLFLYNYEQLWLNMREKEIDSILKEQIKLKIF